MLECVINVSEGRDHALLAKLAEVVGHSILDLHRDEHHNRSVFTLAGPNVVDDAILLTAQAVEWIDIAKHRGVHPRFGAVDVVPFVPLGRPGLVPPLELAEAIAARQTYARTVSEELALPCFLYGPERSLPRIRRTAFQSLLPDTGPTLPHPRAGATCVGARGALIAYNVTVEGLDLASTRAAADAVRSAKLRTLAFDLAGSMQVSCNLIDPWTLGIEEAFDRISREVHHLGGQVLRGELVGLMPEASLKMIPKGRWQLLGIEASSTLESRLI